MSSYRKFTPPASVPEIKISGGTAAKVANPAKVDAPTTQTLATLAGLAGVPLETRDSDAAKDWEFDPLPPAEMLQANISRRLGMGYSDSEAARWAYGAALDDWHRQHGEKMPPGHCAGCGTPVRPTDNVLALPDGAAAHSANNACLIAYGSRWRSAAADGLAEFGVHPPKGWDGEPPCAA